MRLETVIMYRIRNPEQQLQLLEPSLLSLNRAVAQSDGCVLRSTTECSFRLARVYAAQLRNRRPNIGRRMGLTISTAVFRCTFTYLCTFALTNGRDET